MEQGSLNTPPMTRMSSQDLNAYAGWVGANFQPDPDVDISDLLNQLYDLAQVS